MKSLTIPVPIDRPDYETFAGAARLIRKERGDDAPNTIALIQFHLKHHKPDDIAKDFLECTGELDARRRVRFRDPRRARAASRALKLGGRLGSLRSARTPEDVSRN